MKESLKKIYDSRISECCGNLERLFTEVSKLVPIAVICGYRNKEDQNKAYNLGMSKLVWPYSKHNRQPSFAIDVMPYSETEPHINWTDEKGILEFSIIVKGVADRLKIKVIWGGDFLTFKDYCHWEIEQ